MIISHTLILYVTQLQTQQVMTSQTRSHIEYLTDLLYYYAQSVVQIDEKSSLNNDFNTI